MPLVPDMRGGKRGQTVSVGPVGILILLVVWYPLVLAVELAVLIIWGLVWLIMTGCKTASRHRRVQVRDDPRVAKRDG